MHAVPLPVDLHRQTKKPRSAFTIDESICRMLEEFAPLLMKGTRVRSGPDVISAATGEKMKKEGSSCFRVVLSVCRWLDVFLGVVVRCRAEGSTGTRDHYTGGLSPSCGATQKHSVSTVLLRMIRHICSIKLERVSRQCWRDSLFSLLINKSSQVGALFRSWGKMLSMLGFLPCPN